MDKKILVGYSRKDVTPDFSVALTGYGDDDRRMSEGVLDPIFGTCLAFTDDTGSTTLIYSADLLFPSALLVQTLRQAVSQQTGVPEDRIMLATTHSHSAPSTQRTELPSVVAFNRLFVEKMVCAAREALADRAPADIYIGQSKTENMNFVRHYRMADGTYAGDNFGNTKQPIEGHASPADEQIQLIRFLRENKQDILLVNWQAHAKMCSTATSEFGKAHRRHISADFVGYLRKHLEAATKDLVIYFSGASGNLNPDSRITEECPTRDPDAYGKCLADFVLRGLDSMRRVSGGTVTARQQILTVPIDHSDDDRVQLAKAIWALWSTDPDTCREQAKANGFHSAFAARDVIARYESEAARQLELNAIAVGDIAFTAVPYEMFCDNGRQVKENSPFAMTVIMSCTNGYHKYFPSAFAFSHGGYEVDSRLYPRGTAENMAENLVKMLESQKA